MDELRRQRQELEHALKHRCEAAGLAMEELIQEIDDDGDNYDLHYGWSIESKTGAFNESAHLVRNEDVAFALGTKFEEWRPIEGYEAIWSPAHDAVEAEVVLHSESGAKHPFERLARLLGSTTDPRDLSIPVPTREGRPVISLGYASDELKVWRTKSPAAHLINKDSLIPAIRIEGLRLQDANEARNDLEAWANGSFLEIDQCTDVPMRLRTHYPLRINVLLSRPRASLSAVVSAPEPIPARLYWYARQSDHLGRAAQFLGFYHVLEYFFPRYSIAKEAARLRKKLSSASVSIDGVSEDTLKLILSETYGRRGVRKEEDQLKELLKQVVSKDELRNFMGGDPLLREFYRRKAESIPFVSKGIPIEDSEADLHEKSASRLYQIRCRIVHTKEDRRKEAFVPFSAEAAELAADIRLISFLARKALLANTTKLESP